MPIAITVPRLDSLTCEVAVIPAFDQIASLSPPRTEPSRRTPYSPTPDSAVIPTLDQIVIAIRRLAQE